MESANPPSQCLPDGYSPLETRLFMGAQLFGSNIAWLLLGILAVQTYTYYIRSSKDHPFFKALVYSTVFVVIVESVIEGFVAYYLLVSNWGNPGLLKDLTTASIMSGLQPLFSAIPGIVTQSFFTWRIWTFSAAVCRRKAVRLLVAVICLFIILLSVCAFASAITAVGLFSTPKLVPNSIIRIIVLFWTIPTATVDVTITVCMITILRHAKSTAYFGETHHMLSRLLRLTIQTGFLTSLLAIPVTPLYFHYSNSTPIYTLLWFLLGKSYVISLLANLNARSHRASPINADTNDTNGDGRNTRALSPMVFTAGRVHSRSKTNASSGNGVLSFARSIAHTIHRDFTATPTELASHIDGDAQSGRAKAPPGLMHSRSGERGEIGSFV